MAKTKNELTTGFRKKPKVRRRGVHAKKGTSKIKTSKNYVKMYVGQGK